MPQKVVSTTNPLDGELDRIKALASYWTEGPLNSVVFSHYSIVLYQLLQKLTS